MLDDPIKVVGEVDKWLGQKHREMSRTMERKVKKAAFGVEREAKNNLKDHVSTGLLIRSVSTKFVKDGFDSWATVGTSLSPHYGPDLEFGTDPHWPPIEPLKRWAQQRGINPYAVQKSISKKGTDPHPWLNPARDKVLTGFDWSL